MKATLRSMASLTLLTTAVLLTVLTMAVLAATLMGYGIAVNIEPCLPMGDYFLTPAGHGIGIKRGDTVQFCPPENNSIVLFGVRRGWLGAGGCPDGVMPMLKQVAALPGDTVTFTPDALVINGVVVHNSKSRTTTLSGLAMPHIEYGTYTVPANEFLPLGTNSPDSFDGRYFGFVNEKILLHKAKRID